MKRSISHIAWDTNFNDEMYSFINRVGFSGLEIAPTKLFTEDPYSHLLQAEEFQRSLVKSYCIEISSMQSIWFGRKENLFGDEKERGTLLEYSKRAIEFAAAMKCGNLVFGSPKNRIIENDVQIEHAISFFRELGQYAKIQGTVFSIEPNPVIYGTNFINTTRQGIEIVKQVNHEGFRLNLDLGTVIQNEESLSIIADNINLVNHIHISEPYLNPITKRPIHKDLADILRETAYDRYVSIEMKSGFTIDEIKLCMVYVNEVFRDI